MTADIHQGAELRHWLVEYPATNIGSAPAETDRDLPANDPEVESLRLGVPFSGEDLHDTSPGLTPHLCAYQINEI